MKRTVISLTLITVFILAVALGDIYFMTGYAEGMNDHLDAVEKAVSFEEKKACALSMDQFFRSKEFWAHRFVPTGRIEELETLLHKLNSYIKTKDDHEVDATVAELRARVNLLYSTSVYHCYHPTGFRIE